MIAFDPTRSDSMISPEVQKEGRQQKLASAHGFLVDEASWKGWATGLGDAGGSEFGSLCASLSAPPELSQLSDRQDERTVIDEVRMAWHRSVSQSFEGETRWEGIRAFATRRGVLPAAAGQRTIIITADIDESPDMEAEMLHLRILTAEARDGPAKKKRGIEGSSETAQAAPPGDGLRSRVEYGARPISLHHVLHTGPRTPDRKDPGRGAEVKVTGVEHA
ncbi:hypothetical protein G7046_g1299 [Stylonectria norvegica]|nr:hypothetical protein G7046_g1299 [Stylonectria norvegica]